MKNERPWFKAYTHFLLDDPRLGLLPEGYGLVYLQLYALCARDGVRDSLYGTAADLGWRLHRQTDFMVSCFAILEKNRLIAVLEDRIRILDWTDQQPLISLSARRRDERARKSSSDSAA